MTIRPWAALAALAIAAAGVASTAAVAAADSGPEPVCFNTDLWFIQGQPGDTFAGRYVGSPQEFDLGDGVPAGTYHVVFDTWDDYRPLGDDTRYGDRADTPADGQATEQVTVLADGVLSHTTADLDDGVTRAEYRSAPVRVELAGPLTVLEVRHAATSDGPNSVHFGGACFTPIVPEPDPEPEPDPPTTTTSSTPDPEPPVTTAPTPEPPPSVEIGTPVTQQPSPAPQPAPPLTPRVATPTFTG